MESIMDHFNELDHRVCIELRYLVASSGSASMARVLFNESVFSKCATAIIDYCATSINAMNFETLRWFLSIMDGLFEKWTLKKGPLDKWEPKGLTSDDIYFGRFLEALVQSGSLEIFQECKRHLIILLQERSVTRQYVMQLCADAKVIRATAGIIDREHVLLAIWAALEMGNNDVTAYKCLGEALSIVARTTFSIVLAKALLEHGANIDYQRTKTCLTPIQLAARDDSPQAAELIMFFLYLGADPTILPARHGLQICDQKGPRNIAKWIGMSWDELVKMVKSDRERGFCPPEYQLVFPVDLISVLKFCLTKF